MSFCRIGDESDIHAFEEKDGCFTVQVARNRHEKLTDAQEDAMSLLQMHQWLQENSRPIGGRCDGEEFRLGSAIELVDKLRDLLALGYRMDRETWGNIERDYPGSVPMILQVKAPRSIRQR